MAPGTTPGWIPLIALVVYVVSFSIGFGPIPWLMMGEIFPSRIRGIFHFFKNKSKIFINLFEKYKLLGPAASFSTAFNWACTFIVTKTFMNLQVRVMSSADFDYSSI